ncbi:hypothetical protein [Erythrobacter mangrovi]|uniref:Uncharacterized protein n=1 Tax=Erythrobacter mangrovi TaxID=2739433 RepID=A0A7D4CCT7_9SPHN|nr:hypothetical protein [Erythrobacter mangrovi]QKG71069.1 hypothetical protein HQR01_06600 [Erythrobacter mangrovi]
MAGDLGVRERLIIAPAGGAARAPEAALKAAGGRIMHQYGERVAIAEMPPGAEQPLSLTLGRAQIVEDATAAEKAMMDSLSEEEALGVEAFALRQSAKFNKAKAERPRAGESWDSAEGGEPLMCAQVAAEQAGMEAHGLDAQAGAPTSARLTGRVAVGIVIVEGPTNALKFTAAERLKVIAEVQNGLGWLGAQNPAGAVQFVYEIRNPKLTTTPLTGNPTFAQKEERWRDPAMAALGYGAGLGNVGKYANDLRSKFNTNWAYVAFFTKYPLGHFAYASIGGPRLVMDYANDGWGPDNIDRVFAHETGHVFNAPDEYAASGCNVGGSWGYYGKPNSNCANGAPGGGVPCIMKSNSWEMCNVTPYHLGFPLADQRYSGVFVAGSGKYGLWVNASYNSFVNKWQAWSKQGLRLHDIEIVQAGGERRYNGVWRAGTGKHGLWVNASWASFTAKWQEWSRQGLRLVDVDVVRTGGQNRYTGVFLAGGGAYGLWANVTYASFIAKWQEWSAKGLRLVDLKITNFNGQRRYTGVFRAGNGAYGLWVNATWKSFLAKWKEWSGKGMRLVDIEVTNFGGQKRYSGVFASGVGGYGLWVGADWPNFKAKWEEWSKNGLRLIDIEITDPKATVQALELSSALGEVSALDDGPIEGQGEALFGEATAVSGEDVDTGEFVLISEEEQAASAEDEVGSFGGMFAGDAPESAPDHTDASEHAVQFADDLAHTDHGHNGFGGLGGVDADHGAPPEASPEDENAQDGFGGIGGDGSEGGDLDTGVLVGEFG